jgi:ribosome-binding factor A
MPTQRQLRVNNLLQHEIAQIVARELHDPDLGFVTITGVEVTVDLRHAKVFVSVLGAEADKRRSMAALIRARHFIRGLIGDRLDLKYIPELTFRLDETAERAARLERILRESAAEHEGPDEPSAH